jgi:flagellar biosynthesis protein FlhF
MQVRKFEAKSMKEALELVKSQLGPDAIILNAKDNSRRFGLAGQGSVEVTAAVPEEKLHLKKFAESKLPPKQFEQFSKAPARTQKKFIEETFTRHQKQLSSAIPQRVAKYVDIDDSDGAVNPLPKPSPVPASSKPNLELTEIHRLKEEIASLKNTIAQLNGLNIQKPAINHQTFPGYDFGLRFESSGAFEKLIAAGLSEDISAEMILLAQKAMPVHQLKNKSLLQGFLARHILEQTVIMDSDSHARLQVFMGPPGSGKTSMLIKMASELLVNKRKKVAIVTTDTRKVGASEQLRIFAQILNIPFVVLRDNTEWDPVFNQLRNVEVFLVDTAGNGLRTHEDVSELARLLPSKQMAIHHHLVLSALTKESDVTEMGRRFKNIGLQDVIFTFIEECAQHGTIYNFMKRFKTPLHSFGIGPKIPEDFEWASKERMLDLIFKLTKLKAAGASE